MGGVIYSSWLMQSGIENIFYIWTTAEPMCFSLLNRGIMSNVGDHTSKSFCFHL